MSRSSIVAIAVTAAPAPQPGYVLGVFDGDIHQCAVVGREGADGGEGEGAGEAVFEVEGFVDFACGLDEGLGAGEFEDEGGEGGRGEGRESGPSQNFMRSTTHRVSQAFSTR